MAVCPKCKTELNGEFGMTQCPSCGAFSFIGDDGIARAPEDEAPAADASGASEPSFEPPLGGNADFGFAPFDPGSSEESAASPAGFEPIAPFETPEITEEPPLAYDPAPSSVIDVPSGFDAPASPEAPMESFGMDSFQSVTPVDEEVPAQEPEPEVASAPMAFGPADDPLNLNDFANSEVSSGRDGPLLFRVLITGIDTKEIRESIREVLNDDRFRLDAASVMQRVSKGNLVIDGLSPVKASILVNRIKRLPITIRWEQYAITEANP